MSETDQSEALGRLQGLVLLVDDDESVRRVTAMVLRRVGLRVETAKDGRQALEQLDERPPDLLLIDCNLPGIDGLSVVRERRRREETEGLDHVLVVAMTGDPTATGEGVCLAAGADGFLAKPVGITGLLEVIGRLLSGN